jgi:hypothetical protein
MTENFKETYKGGFQYHTANDFVTLPKYNDEIKTIPQLAEKRKVIDPSYPKYMNKYVESKVQDNLLKQSQTFDGLYTSREIPYSSEPNPIYFYKNKGDIIGNPYFYKVSDFTTLNDLSRNNDFMTLREIDEQ